MPTRWRTNFVNSGQSIQQVSTEVLRTYTVQQESQTDAHWKKVRDSNKKQSKTPFNKGKSDKHNKKYNSNFNGKHTNNNKDQRKPKKLSNDDDCPIHRNPQMGAVQSKPVWGKLSPKAIHPRFSRHFYLIAAISFPQWTAKSRPSLYKWRPKRQLIRFYRR